MIGSLDELGEFAEGITRGEEAVQIAEAIDHPFSLWVAYNSLGNLYLRKGDFQRAIPPLERALAIARTNIPPYISMSTCSLSDAYALSGRVAEALPLLEQVVEQATTSIGASASYVASFLIEACLLAGHIGDASHLAEHFLMRSRSHKERGLEAHLLRLLGEIASHRDPPEVEQAEAYYRQALALADELGMRPLIAHCHLGLGILYRQTRRPEQARAELYEALELFRSMEMTFWLGKAEGELAEVG